MQLPCVQPPESADFPSASKSTVHKLVTSVTNTLAAFMPPRNQALRDRHGNHPECQTSELDPTAISGKDGFI
jgi:hypothetical protein